MNLSHELKGGIWIISLVLDRPCGSVVTSLLIIQGSKRPLSAVNDVEGVEYHRPHQCDSLWFFHFALHLTYNWVPLCYNSRAHCPLLQCLCTTRAILAGANSYFVVSAFKCEGNNSCHDLIPNPRSSSTGQSIDGSTVSTLRSYDAWVLAFTLRLAWRTSAVFVCAVTGEGTRAHQQLQSATCVSMGREVNIRIYRKEKVWIPIMGSRVRSPVRPQIKKNVD